MRLNGKPWRVEMSGFGECVDYRKRTRHKLDSRWSRGVFVGVRVKTIERIVMDETGTYVVQSVRRVPEEQRRDLRLLQSVRGTPWEPNPGDVSSDMPESPPQLPDVEPTPTRYTTVTTRGPKCLHPQNWSWKVRLHRGMFSMRRTYRGMQETTRECNGHRWVHSDSSQSNAREKQNVSWKIWTILERRIPAVWVALVNTNTSDLQNKSAWIEIWDEMLICRPLVWRELQRVSDPLKLLWNDRKSQQRLQKPILTNVLAWKAKPMVIPVILRWRTPWWIHLRNCGTRKTIRTVKLICSFLNSVITTLQVCTKLAPTSQCVKEPRHFSHMMNVIGTTLMTRVANCSTTRLSRRQEPRKFQSSVSLVSGKFSTDTVMRSCLAHDGSTSIVVTKANLSTAVDWSGKSTNVKRIGHFSQRPHRSKLCEACWSVGQLRSSPMTWDSQLLGPNLWFWCWHTFAAHIFSQRCPEKCLWSFLWKPARTRAKLAFCSGACMDAETLEWKLGICVSQVIIATVLVQFRTSPCIYRHLEKQLRVWVEGNDCVSLLYCTSPKSSGSFRNCKSCGSSRIEESVDPSEYDDCVQGIRVLGRILDMPNWWGNRSEWLVDQSRHLDSETRPATPKEWQTRDRSRVPGFGTQ